MKKNQKGFTHIFLLTILISIFGITSNTFAKVYKKDPGPYDVESAMYEWLDQKRNREVPVKVYFPKNAEGPFPLIIFSHGLGGSRDGYEFLGRHWASHGYVSVHVQHIGSDTAIWQGKQNIMEAMRQAIRDPANSTNRPLDVSFALDQMERLNKEDSPFRGFLEMKKIGVAGHSYGAYTTLAVAGQVFISVQGSEVTFEDPRVKAAIAMSASVGRARNYLEKAYSRIDTPCLHMTGTEDHSPIGTTTVEERRLPFDHIDGADQYLIIFKDGDHMVFAGQRLWPGGGKKDPLFHDLIRMSSTAFWDCYLNDNDEAKQWLADGGFESELGEDGTLEKKIK